MTIRSYHPLRSSSSGANSMRCTFISIISPISAPFGLIMRDLASHRRPSLGHQLSLGGRIVVASVSRRHRACGIDAPTMRRPSRRHPSVVTKAASLTYHWRRVASPSRTSSSQHRHDSGSVGSDGISAARVTVTHHRRLSLALASTLARRRQCSHRRRIIITIEAFVGQCRRSHDADQ